VREIILLRVEALVWRALAGYFEICNFKIKYLPQKCVPTSKIGKFALFAVYL
jgi:hypothetical protein